MVRKSASVCLILGLLFPGMALALGLGELTVKSYLNEPLRAEVDLLETQELDTGQVKIRLAAREDFDRAGVERAYFLTDLKFEVILGENRNAVLMITSSEPVREPYLDFIVEARWPTGRLLREYTVLLDPPLFSGPGSGITHRASVTAPEPTAGRRQAAPPDTPAEPPRPQRQYGADAQPEPQAGAEYLVQRADTLWRIASRSRPAGTSIQQTMLDIQRLNPEAFIGNNINQLKAGYVLRLPTSAEISTDAEQAVAAVAEQDQNWQDNLTAIDTSRLDASEGQDSSGVAGSDDGEGHLQIAGVEGAAEAAAMAGDLSARLEDLDRAQRDNQDLQARLESMDQQLQMQQRLIELKDDQISALQQALTEPGEEGSGAIDQVEGTIEPLEQTGADLEPVEAEPEPEPRPAPPPPPPEPTLVDMLMEYALYIGVGVLVLLFVIVWLLRNKLSIGGRRRAKQEKAGAAEEDDEFAGVELVSDDALIVDEFTGEIDEEAGSPEAITSFSSAADEDAYAAQFESGDALAEADIYIAYGRFPQAVDLLKTAIGMEPVNTDYRLKLMEACIEMVESSEYQQQYADLQLIGDETVLQRAKSMLEAVDGGEVWLDDLPEPSITEEDVAAAKAAAEAPAAAEPALEVGHYDVEDEPAEEGEIDLGSELSLDDVEAGDDGLDLELDEDAGLSLDETEDSSTGLDLELDDADLGEPEQDSGSVDLDLDLELESSDESGEEGGEDAGAPLEFDMGDELEELSADTEADAAEEVDAGTDATLDADDLDLGDLELEDLAMDEPAEDTSTAEAAVLELDEGSDGTDLDQFDMESIESEPDAEPADEPLETDSIDLPDLELDEISAGGGDKEEAGEDLLSDFGSLEIEPGDEEDTAAEELVLDEGLEDLGGSIEEELGESVEDFDLDSFADGGDEPTAEADATEESGEGGEVDSSGLMFATDGDEVATKLDLARAYMDMGDHDGARSILEEVLEDGNDGQKQEAQTLLDSID